MDELLLQLANLLGVATDTIQREGSTFLARYGLMQAMTNFLFYACASGVIAAIPVFFLSLEAYDNDYLDSPRKCVRNVIIVVVIAILISALCSFGIYFCYPELYGLRALVNDIKE